MKLKRIFISISMLFTGDLSTAPKQKEKVEVKKTVKTAPKDNKEEKAAVAPEVKISKSLGSILVADDEKPLAKALQLKLESEGFKVTTAFNGEEALDYILKNSFDLVLLDLVMPKLDGFGVLKNLRESGKKTPVIVTSNLSQPEDIKKAKEELGAIEFFIKSNTPIKEIIAFVKNYLNNAAK